MRQVARSPKRSSHEDSDVQRDVNIRVHEGAIDSVAMRMIMSKKESGAGENNTPFHFAVVAVFGAPPAPPISMLLRCLTGRCKKECLF